MRVANSIESVKELKKLNGIIRVPTGNQHDIYGLCIQGENKQSGNDCGQNQSHGYYH
jgi:hypothetical protein